ncbi:hypothetical protein ACFTZK_01045 [Streptomyces decoyicus]|uniref:hypothetical protein n=1 Tax=Streptomyces decoyicus TaxID=249567 RepID=UPI00362AD428
MPQSRRSAKMKRDHDCSGRVPSPPSTRSGGRSPGAVHRWTPAPAARKVRTRTGRRSCDFKGSSIYGNPDAGAHEVHGAVRDLWQRMGWERSFLRCPVSDGMGHPHQSQQQVPGRACDLAPRRRPRSAPRHPTLIAGGRTPWPRP